MNRQKMVWNIGDYPPEYNPRVHGVYNPSVYYGKQYRLVFHYLLCYFKTFADINFWDLKLREIPAWIGRRKKTPRAFVQAINRANWRWSLAYHHCRYVTATPYLQVIVLSMIVFCILNHKKWTWEAHYKYH